ncbi:PB1 domain containing protein [Nitzschia inconspicua]|uniref:PB1 domain containing protein n=1 Tax=Nitzschia inconspicua TaxID=303405 RepID=A0A9K3K7I7_9STRA|nr:PB1 domain containing protein [Nitzschia inconspicua]KAG7359984.1 PB1 domain containing protein [Nitzschia inconspicua]
MPSSSFFEKCPDFVLKLKIKAADGQTQIRRVRLIRIADGEGEVSYKELVNLVVVSSFPETRTSESSPYNVSLTYHDVDGDSVTIASSDELVDACEQYVGQKVLRIHTNVKPNTMVAPATAAGRASNKRAMSVEAQRPGTDISPFTSPASPRASNKRTRMSSKKPHLPLHRFDGEGKNHVAVIVKEQRRCTYCKYEFAMAKLNGTHPLPTVARPSRKCSTCGDHLCKPHFEVFHQGPLPK